MNQKNIYQLFAALSFIISFIIYLVTMAPTTSLWDCGEFIATSVIMGVPHPPGAPLYLIIGNVFSQLPFYENIGARVNLISPLVSALSVLFLYFIIVSMLKIFMKKSENNLYTIYISSFLASLTFAFSDSQWFNAVEAEVYSISTLFTAFVVWLILKWNEKSEDPGNIKYIILIFYILGLAIGIHLLNLLTLPFIGLIILFNKKEIDFKISKLTEINGKQIYLLFTTLFFVAITFFIIYNIIIKGIPQFLSYSGFYSFVFLIALIVGLLVYTISKRTYFLSAILSCLVMILIGYSTYITIFIRASQHPSINENNPDNFKNAISYINREQYGDLGISRAKTLQRDECRYSFRWTENPNEPKFSEVMNFIWGYQIKEMYLRYFAWQFIGRGQSNWDLTSIDGKYIKSLDGINGLRYILPLAFIFGILGIRFHFRNDWKRALAVMSLFLSTGIIIILYLNQYDPQPRERDYSFVGSFFTFAIWIGFGISWFFNKLDQLKIIDQSKKILKTVSSVLIFSLMPLNMIITDFHEHDRSEDYAAWDYAYNLLNSCEPGGIIFTNGDNDTFPLWYLQEVEHIRRDVRVVNLSLLNTNWYIEQLKNQDPKVPIPTPGKYLDKINPIDGTAYALNKWTTDWKELEKLYNEYAMKEYNQKYDPRTFGIPEWETFKAKITINTLKNPYSKKIKKYLQISNNQMMDYNGQIVNTENSEPMEQDSIVWNIKPTLYNQYLRVQDIMIFEIIAGALLADRPVYFAVTVAPQNRIGLDRYLEMQGMVYRVTTEAKDLIFSSPRIDYDMMYSNIIETSDYSKLIKTPEDFLSWEKDKKGKYRYTNLNNPKNYLNETVLRLIQNYRAGFLHLLENRLNGEGEQQNQIDTLLTKMDTYFPPELLTSSDPMLEIQIAQMYYEINAKDKWRERLLKIYNRESIDLSSKISIGEYIMDDDASMPTAIEIFEDLYEMFPEYRQITKNLIISYAKNNQIENAVKVIDDWMFMNTNDSEFVELKNFLLNEQN